MEELRQLIEDYKVYGKKEELKPKLHATHLALMMDRLAKLSRNYSNGGNINTDAFINNVNSLSLWFRSAEAHMEWYNDTSEVYKLVDAEYSQSSINTMVDILIHLLIYIGGNDLQEPFITRLKEVMLKDKEKTSKVSRFRNKRIELSTRTEG